MYTFTCGFDLSSASGLELSFDERPYAEMLANQYKTEHYEVVLHAGDMEHVMAELVWHLEDLRVGQSYPNFYIARLASKFVKVVLSGTGGDELFAGYPWRYYTGLTARNKEEYIKGYYGYWQRLVPDEDKSKFFQPWVYKHLKAHNTFEVFRDVLMQWPGPLETPEERVEASLYLEFKTFLHGLLIMSDKLSMAHGLEERVPFLDNALVDLAAQIPVKYKLATLMSAPVDENLVEKKILRRQTREGKLILRQALRLLSPKEIVNRPKQGFAAPDGSWFRGESLRYVRDLLLTDKACIHEFVRREYIEDVLMEHVSGRRNRRLLIWSLISFEWWLRRFLG